MDSSIERTFNSLASSIKHVRIDHFRSDIFVAEKLLHGSDVVTVFQQVSSKAVAERVTSGPFVNAAPTNRLFNCFLQYPLANMMSIDSFDLGSRLRWLDGNTNCHLHSRSACVYSVR